MNQDFAICIQFSKENLRKTIDLCYNIDVSRALLASEREVFLFSPFSSLAKVNNVLQSEQTRKRSISSSMAMFLFLDQAFILPFATFFTPIFLRGHFSPLITFFFFFSFVAHFLQVTSRRFVAFLQEGSCVETQFRATWIFGFKADGRIHGLLFLSQQVSLNVSSKRTNFFVQKRFIFRSPSWKRRNLLKWKILVQRLSSNEDNFQNILLDGLDIIVELDAVTCTILYYYEVKEVFKGPLFRHYVRGTGVGNGWKFLKRFIIRSLWALKFLLRSVFIKIIPFKERDVLNFTLVLGKNAVLRSAWCTYTHIRTDSTS